MVEKRKMHIKKGDNVIVLSGKDKGKKGKIIEAIRSSGKVIIEGINKVHKHMRPTQKNPQGGVMVKEAPVYGCKVMLLCPSCDKPTRISKMILSDGKKTRVCKNCEEIVDSRK